MKIDEAIRAAERLQLRTLPRGVHPDVDAISVLLLKDDLDEKDIAALRALSVRLEFGIGDLHVRKDLLQRGDL